MPKFFYDPYDWYWKAEDGRIYSSKRQTNVTDTDADLLSWCGEGDDAAVPQFWPRDDAGAQTDAALQAVLDPYGLTINPAAP
ncbi:hypothetical protein [Bradyrhizobium sp. 170]|uniref:hypothetical protein n=1 Tax=Bradyrhizobium sp. 170 TaxID=2782641 RepID=UPI001FFF61DB|nr:hypothetical protein [Bradyrhizobium sp. 170]UPK03091.1 hypothetical protein IVB05_37035 [Bradyrhizobium sp. 170]